MGRAQERVLQAIANGRRYGFDIMSATGLPSGAVYQALAGLERLGHVRSHWEQPDVATREKRPRRRYYAITRSGRAALIDAVERYRAFERDMPAGLVELEPRHEPT